MHVCRLLDRPVFNERPSLCWSAWLYGVDQMLVAGCPSGRYQSNRGSSACISCGNNTSSLGSGPWISRQSCVCASGFWGLALLDNPCSTCPSGEMNEVRVSSRLPRKIQLAKYDNIIGLCALRGDQLPGLFKSNCLSNMHLDEVPPAKQHVRIVVRSRHVCKQPQLPRCAFWVFQH